MAKKKRFWSAMLSVCMTVSAVPAVYAADGAAAQGGASGASDINGHWASTAMQEFIDAGYIKGSGGKYTPDGNMSRAQFSAIVNRMMGYSAESRDISKFKDIKTDSWYRSDLAKALAAGYMSGTSSDTMSPEASVTREQAFVILARILKLSATESEADKTLASYKDAGSVAPWAKNSVAALVKAGYVSGDNNGNINPKKSLTRAEGVTVLHRSRKAGEQKPEVKNKYADGVYTGTGAGYGGTMKLQVTIKDGKISDIKILSESETGSYLNRAKSIIQKIIDKNGTDGVSAVSGATKTSNGIFTAVNACLSQAQGGKDTSTTGSTGGGHGGSGNATKPSDNDIDGNWKDGTYTGTAQGYSYQGVTATVKVVGGKITEIVLKNNGDTPSYYADATGKTKSGKTIIEEIISDQTTNKINAVSGATKTSYAIVNAVKNALKQAVKEQTPGDDPTAPLNDGVWYGTATEGYTFNVKGPNILRVTVENGIIKDVSTVKFVDDNGGFQQKAESLFTKAMGKSSVAEIREQITNRRGESYDVVSGATFSSMSYVTAMENALARSRAGGEQKIAWIELAEKPSIVYFDEAFDMSRVVLNVYLSDNPSKAVKVKGNEIEQYGITASLRDGSAMTDGRVVKADDVDANKTFKIEFREKASRSAAYMNAYTRTRTNKREATHIVVKYANQREKIINIVSGEFRHTLTPISHVESMELYEGDMKLCDGNYYKVGNYWWFDLDNVAPGEGNAWIFKNYRVDVDPIKDDSAIKSFTLSAPEAAEYQVGQKLNMSGVTVNAVTENENTLKLSWSDAVKRGFACDPEDGYKFTESDLGTKTVTVSLEGAEAQTFSVAVLAVIEIDKLVPDTLKITKGSETVLELSGLSDEWPESGYYFTKKDLVLDSKYEGTSVNELNAEIKNKAGEIITAKINNFKKNSSQITLLNENGELYGAITLAYTFEVKEISYVPETLKIMKGDETVLELSELSNEWPEDNYFKKSDLTVDSKFKGTPVSELKLEIKNKDGDNLNATLKYFKDKILQIELLDGSGNGFGSITLSYEMKEMAVSPIPDTVRLLDGDKVVLEVTGLTDEWTDSKSLIKRNVNISKEYQNKKTDEFTVEVSNKDGKKLNAALNKFTNVMTQVSVSDEYAITIVHNWV